MITQMNPAQDLAPKKKTIEISGLNFFYGKTQSLHNVNLDIHEKKVTPSSDRPVAENQPCCAP